MAAESRIRFLTGLQSDGYLFSRPVRRLAGREVKRLPSLPLLPASYGHTAPARPFGQDRNFPSAGIFDLAASWLGQWP